MTREIIPFNRNWKYMEDFKPEYLTHQFLDDHFSGVNLPHCNREIPYNYFDEKMYQFISCYRKILNIPKKFEHQCIFIDFEAIMTYAEVYLNGELVGSHKGGYTPFTINLTGKIKFDQDNLLAIKVDSTERPDIPPFGNLIDYLTYGGIYREVSLRVVNPIYIENVFAQPQDILDKRKKLTITAFIENHSGKSKELNIIAVLKKDNLQLAHQRQWVSIHSTTQNKSEIVLADLSNIELWDVDNPNLYQLDVFIEDNRVIIDNFSTRVGFREAVILKDGFFLNGNKLAIIGLNRHQSFPYVGYAMPERAQKKDADILKYELGVNTVRTSHYPQSRHFLNRCDEIGLLVMEEIPGWQYIGDDQWKQVACENVREMIKRDWNHPAIFLWGVRINESNDDHDFYAETNRIAHELDSTRQTGGVRFIWRSEFLEDVYTANDFSHKEKEEVLQDQRVITGLPNHVPYLVTEFNGHMFPTKKFDQEERLVEHSLRHIEVLNAAGTDQHIAGAIGWCAFDYNTHMDFGSGDRICYHGVMDMFRIPKFAAYVYKSQLNPEKEVVMEPVTLWARGERDRGKVVPILILTNCDYVELFSNGTKIGRYYPSFKEYPGLSHPPVMIHEIEGDWGYRWNEGEFKGYLKGKQVVSKKYSKNPIATKLVSQADDDRLLADGTDVTRIVYKIVDQYGNIIPYISDFLRLSISGPGEVVGPSEIALIGGSIATWVKAKEQPGEIVLKAVSSRVGPHEIILSAE